MRLLLLNPWTYVIAVVVVLALVAGGYKWGATATANRYEAAAGKAAAKAEAAEDKRDENVDAIAAATAAATAAALNDNQGSTHESIERIRTVVVPGACRAADPVVVRELREAADGVNAAIRAGVRPGATSANSRDR